MRHPDRLRVAIVHDWLTGMRGGEKVLEVLCELYPQATLFTLLHNEGSVSPTIEAMTVRTSFLQRAPFKTSKYRNYLPLMPKAVESFDLREFDLVLSTSHAVAKGAIPAKHALHICYCHTPMRYVWDQYADYFGPGRGTPVSRWIMSALVERLRDWDVRTSDRVTHFIANSRNVADRIRRYYGRSSEVIYAPVDTTQFRLSRSDAGYYLIVSALVPYKRLEIAIQAFNTLRAPLVIAGNGPERARLEKQASSNVRFLGWQSGKDLAELYRGCKALVFPGVEDFGIVPLEAMSCGKPVIAYGKGGARETVVAQGKGKTGLFFDEQTVPALMEAVQECAEMRFSPVVIRKHALKFDRRLFKRRLHRAIERKIRSHFSGARS